MRDPFLHTLTRRVLLTDGGMGTELYARGFFINRCFDELNLSASQVVNEVHAAFRTAGAEIIETNTFGANRVKLSHHGFGDRLKDINAQGAKLARDAAGADAYVAASVGPLGVRIEPWGPTGIEEARGHYREQIEALTAAGHCDLVILETFTDLAELHQALLAARDVCALPVIASMTIDAEGCSLYGTKPEVFTQRLTEWGADLVGLNCSVGPAPMLDTVEKMLRCTDRPLCVMPNAGMPREIEGRNLYLASPEYMAEFAMRFIRAGVSIVGGCCGTTPESIKAMRGAVRMASANKQAERPHTDRLTVAKVADASAPSVAGCPTREKSPFAEMIADGRFVVSVELTPPRGWDPEKTIDKAKQLAQAGVDAINIPDGPRASCRLSSSALSVLIKEQTGIEVIPHYCCRDRNMLGMMSDLLGLAALGLRNILIITGDPPKMGDYGDATAVFDVDAIGLVNIANQLNHGVDPGGNPIDPPTRWHIGVGVNPGSDNLDKEIRRFEWKVKAGAEFAITQPVFDPEKLLDFLPRIEQVRIPILAGVWPLTSYRNALFMSSEVPGADVPEPILERMRAASEQSPEAAREEGLAVAREAVRRIAPFVQGIQVSAPFGRVKSALDVIAVLDELPVKRR